MSRYDLSSEMRQRRPLPAPWTTNPLRRIYTSLLPAHSIEYRVNWHLPPRDRRLSLRRASSVGPETTFGENDRKNHDMGDCERLQFAWARNIEGLHEN